MLDVRYIFRVVMAVALSAVQLHAGLTFDKPMVEDTIAPGVKSYPFEFAFENIGEATVEISEIKTTCDCTTAKLERMRYAAGESGVIKGTFSVGSRRGMQEKIVRVLTKDLVQPEIQLTLKLDIPQLVTMKPRMLFWSASGEPSKQEVFLETNKAYSVKIISIESDSDFYNSSLINLAATNEYQLSIVPRNLDDKGQSIVKILLESDFGRSEQYLYLLTR